MTFETIVNIIVLIVVILYFGVQVYLSFKGKSKEEILKAIKEKAYQLFLFAEKQGWTGADKMTWCANQIIKLFPENMRKYIEKPIQEWLQELYNEFKKYIYIEEAATLGIEVDIVSK